MDSIIERKEIREKITSVQNKNIEMAECLINTINRHNIKMLNLVLIFNVIKTTLYYPY